MEFIMGLCCGIGVALAVWSWQRQRCRCRRGVEKPGAKSSSPSPRGMWAQTRNFLYYDGTVMPEIKHAKEDTHEQ